MPQEKSNSTAATLAGLSLTGAGLAHFVRPDLFAGIVSAAFPDDVARHTQINGTIETALGVGFLVPQTRKLAVLGAVGYVAYLGANVLRNR